MELNKKGFMRTIEATIAFVVLLLFGLFAIQSTIDRPTIPHERILPELEQDSTFRTCVFDANASCVESLVQSRTDDPVVVSIDDPTIPQLSGDVYAERILLIAPDGSAHIVRTWR